MTMIAALGVRAERESAQALYLVDRTIVHELLESPIDLEWGAQTFLT